jgi:hypothetical protein
LSFRSFNTGDADYLSLVKRGGGGGEDEDEDKDNGGEEEGEMEVELTEAEIQYKIWKEASAKFMAEN